MLCNPTLLVEMAFQGSNTVGTPRDLSRSHPEVAAVGMTCQPVPRDSKSNIEDQARDLGKKKYKLGNVHTDTLLPSAVSHGWRNPLLQTCRADAVPRAVLWRETLCLTM